MQVRVTIGVAGCAAVVAAGVCTALVAAQTTRPSSAAASQPASQPVGLFRFTDPAFGFELQLPAGWDYDRTRFQQYKDSIGLLRGRGAGGRRALQIVVFRSFPMKPFEDWIVEFGKATAELANSARVDWATWTLPPRAGAILSYATTLGAVKNARSHCLCLPFDPNTVWVFIYSGAVTGDGEEQQCRQEFDQIIGTLRVYYDPSEAERLAPALQRGQALIEKVQKVGSRAQLDDGQYFYELTLAGKPLGFFQRRIAREEFTFSQPGARRRASKEGIRVRERVWRFADDGTARFGRVDLFSSFDREDELIEDEEVHIPPAETGPQEVFTRLDKAIRERDVLILSSTNNRDRALPEPSKPLSVGPAYLDLAWVRLLPGILLSMARDNGAATKPPAASQPAADATEPYAVAVYSADVRSLLCHVIRFLGERKAPGHEGRAFAFEVREGFVDAPSMLYTDARGTLLRLEAGDLVVNRVPREEIERKYGPQRNAASRRFEAPRE